METVKFPGIGKSHEILSRAWKNSDRFFQGSEFSPWEFPGYNLREQGWKIFFEKVVDELKGVLYSVATFVTYTLRCLQKLGGGEEKSESNLLVRERTLE